MTNQPTREDLSADFGGVLLNLSTAAVDLQQSFGPLLELFTLAASLQIIPADDAGRTELVRLAATLRAIARRIDDVHDLIPHQTNADASDAAG